MMHRPEDFQLIVRIQLARDQRTICTKILAYINIESGKFTEHNV
jgi:hypothetical protein